MRGLSFRYDAQDAPVLGDLDAAFAGSRAWSAQMAEASPHCSSCWPVRWLMREVLARAPVHCPQRTTRRSGLDVLLAGEDAELGDSRAPRRPYDADARWRTLSRSERKRAQIAVALHQAPDLLTIDEPTNHIDADTREMLEGALGTFRSRRDSGHDRDLLDTLCVRCLWFEGQRSRLLSGGYSAGRAVLNAEAAAQAMLTQAHAPSSIVSSARRNSVVPRRPRAGGASRMASTAVITTPRSASIAPA